MDRVDLCSECGEPIRWSGGNGPPPTTCWRPLCVATGTWLPEQWAQQARFARIRKECGLSVSVLGLMALERAA